MNNKKNSNRGGALLSVVIVMAIAGILGALAMSIAYTNFTMKVVDKKSKDNFYSAEKVLEEICVGLEKVASDEYKRAYTEVMSQYSPDKEGSDMEEEFKNLFVVNMISKLKVSGDATKYLVGDKTTNTGLYEYVKNTYGNAVYNIQSVDNKIDTLEDGFALRNVNITYQDGSYYNDITTDIKISIPEVHFTKVSAMPEIAEFSFVAEGGVLVDGGTTTDNLPTVGMNVVGKVYSGVDSQGKSFVLESGSIFNANHPESVLVVSKGDIYLEGITSFATGNKTALWTESITTKEASRNTSSNQLIETNNSIVMNGRVYVNDDTTLNGYKDSLVLSGQYYGFSNSNTDASGSSSIIVNGKDIQINMSQLDTLVLAGTSFVGTNGHIVDTEKDAGKDILMGDSIAIKSNQLAYLVPTECNGIPSNPMTHAQFEALPVGWKETALTTRLTSIHSTLADYGEVDIVPVFSPNQQDGGTVYLYLNFADSETASRYFMTYYANNKTAVDKYLNSYLEGFSFTSTTQNTTRIVTQGNYLLPVTGNNEAKYMESTGDAALHVQELTNYESSYSALCKKLITNYSALTNDEIAETRTVYSNLVDESKIDEFFTLFAGGKIQNTGVTYSSTNGTKKAVFDGEVKVYIVDNNDTGTDSVYPVEGSAGVVIATGDVIVSGNWKGLIICGGKLTKTGTLATMTHDPEAVGKAMQMGWAVNVTTTDADGNTSTTQEHHKVLNFFRSGNTYTTGTFGDKAEMTDVRNLISYENYKSE